MDLVIHYLLQLFIVIVLLLLLILFKNPIFLLLLILYITLSWSKMMTAMQLLKHCLPILTASNKSKALYTFSHYVFNHVLHTQFSSLQIVPKGRKVIYVLNYPQSFLEYLAVGLFKDTTLIARKFSQVGPAAALSQLVFDKKNYIEVSKTGNTYEELKEKIGASRNSLIAYVENQKLRKNYYTLTPLRTGIFSISHQLNIPIIPVIVDHIKTDGYGNITEPNFTITFGKLYEPTKYITASEYQKVIAKWMKQTLATYRPV